MWHIFWRGYSRLRSGREHWAWMVVVEVRQGTLGGDTRGWGPAGNTGRGYPRLRSGRDHWAGMVVVEVRQGTLGGDTRGWGPAGNTGGDGRGWGPAGNTGRGWSRLRSDRDLELAVEVRLCPLGSGLRGGGGGWAGGGDEERRGGEGNWHKI